MDINYLVDLIKKDLDRGGSYDRYPVRFLSMRYEEGTSDTLIKLQTKLNAVDIFDVKDILPHEDAWITVDNIRKTIYALDRTKNYIVIGFSEYARFLQQTEFITLIISLLELENPAENAKRRIYIPCFALYNQIKKIINKHHRRVGVYNPLLNDTDIEDLPRIYFVNDKLNADYYENEVINSADWFGMWRNPNVNPKYPIICSSPTLIYFYKLASRDNVYNIEYLDTYQDILKKIYNISNLRSYDKNSDEFFSKMISLVKSARNKELKDIILSEVNAQNIDYSNIYYLWKVNNTFNRWLIQNYILIYTKKNTYLYKVMDTLEDLTDNEFIEKTYEIIFEYKDISLSDERKAILASIKNFEKDINFTNRLMKYYENFILNIIRKKIPISYDRIDFTKDDEILVGNYSILSEIFEEELIPYLTSFSEYERQLIIWLYRIKLINDMQIKNVYPSLWDYINENDSNGIPEEYSDKFDKYFETYRKVRLAQISGCEYEEALHTWNQNENTFYDWYFSGKIEYPEIYFKKKNFDGKIYVLDGVGAEYLGFIVKLLEKKGYIAVTIAYGKCHLPSISSIAKEFYPSEYEWIHDYDDKVIHGNTYYNVQNIEKGLTFIENIIDRIISIEREAPFAITADHGATVGHKIRKKDKKYNYEESEHDGRCYLNKQKRYVEPSNDYIVYDDETGKQWVIALNQQSLNNNSKYVAHGGATLEEVLVPIIIAQKNKQLSKCYRVYPVDLNVSGLKRKVEFRITPMLKGEKAILKAKDGTNTELIYNEETKTWIGEVRKGIEQNIEISIGNQNYEFRTIPPTKMGDDLFND